MSLLKSQELRRSKVASFTIKYPPGTGVKLLKNVPIWESLKTLFQKSPPLDVEAELESAAAYQAAQDLDAAAQAYLRILSHYPDKGWWYNKS